MTTGSERHVDAASGAGARPQPGNVPLFLSLRRPNVRRFFAGLLVSNIGTWLQLTAMALLVYRLTGRATDLGITVALQFLPMLALGAWAGALADRHDKRRLAMLAQAGLMVQAVVLGLIDLAGLASVPVVWALVLVLGVLNAFENPARRGLVTELVEPGHITNAMSLNTAVMTGSRIFGPALASLLVDAVGTAWCFLINGVSFGAILLSLGALRPAELHPSPRAPRGGRPVREALSFVRHHSELAVVFIVMTIVSTFAFNYQVALPKLADARWGGAGWFGLVLSVSSVGSVIGSLLTARLAWVTIGYYFANVVLLGVSGLGMAWAPNLGMALAWAVPLGLGGAGFISGANGIIQQHTPGHMRGRMMAFTAVAFLGSIPIGGPITGLIGDGISAEWGLAYGSVAALLTVAIGALLAGGRPSPGREGSSSRATVSQ